MGLDPAEPGLRPAGVPPPERSAGGGGRPAAPRFARCGSTKLHQTNPWNCSAGEDPLPEPCRTELREGPRVLLQQNQDLVEFSADEGCSPEPESTEPQEPMPTQVDPSGETSFFQMGTICLRRSMAYVHASRAGWRCAAATAITTLASPIPSRPTR